MLAELRQRIEELYELPTEELLDDADDAFEQLRDALTAGSIRAAEPTLDGWQTNAWVKKGILLGFRRGRTVRLDDAGPLGFVDKDNLPVRCFDDTERVRVVPGGSSVRHGAFIGHDVICMPPMFVNIGAYVGAGSLIDSHALVGSCAQIGARVHVSAAAQIGGVLEPVGALPVIIEDDVLVGGNCGIYEGTVVGREAVIAAGTILTASTPVFDTVRAKVLRAAGGQPLVIPPGAVVVPGSRPAKGEFAARHSLHVATPLIVKYRDAGTDAAVALEDALRA